MDFFYWLGLLVFLCVAIHVFILVFADCDVRLFFAELIGKKTSVLAGKVIWITGSSSGIGEGLALACAQAGAKLVLTARRETELERVKKECIKVSKGKLKESDVLVLPFDVSSTQDHQKHFDRVLEVFGKLDILVNNAGRSQRCIWEDVELDVDRQMFELNVFSILHLSRIAVKYFLSRGDGHVALTSSIAGVADVPYSGSYNATKCALHGYFNSLRIEKSEKNLAVTIFCPGPTFTNFLQECFTSKSGETYGQSTQSTDKRMTLERCGQLFAVALANRMDECWAAVVPVTILCYMFKFTPLLMALIIKVLGAKRIFKIRDSRVAMKVD